LRHSDRILVDERPELALVEDARRLLDEVCELGITEQAETTVLYELVAQHAQTMLAEVRAAGDVGSTSQAAAPVLSRWLM
jgi:hypothetical protein